MPVNIDAIIKVAAIQGANKVEAAIGNAVTQGISDRLPAAIENAFKRLNINPKNLNVVKDITKEIQGGIGGKDGKGLAIPIQKKTVRDITNLITLMRSLRGETGKSSREIANALGNLLPAGTQRAARSILVAQRAVNQLRKAIASGDAGRVASSSKRIESFLGLDPKKIFPGDKSAQKVFRELRKDFEQELSSFVSSYAAKVRKSSADLAKENAKLAKALTPEEIVAKESQRAAEQTKIAQARQLRSIADERFAILKDVAKRAESQASTLKDSGFVQRVLGEQDVARVDRSNVPSTQQEISRIDDLDKRIEREKQLLGQAKATARELNARLAYEKAIAEGAKADVEAQRAADERIAKLRQNNAKRYLADQRQLAKEREAAAAKEAKERNKAIKQAEKYKLVLADAINISAKVGRPLTAEAQRLRQTIESLERFGAGAGVSPPGGGPPGGGPPPPSGPPYDDDGTLRVVQNQNKINKSLAEGRFTIESFGKSAALAAKRYAAFLVGSAVFFQLSSAIRSAATNALEFESIITKVQQVLSTTNAEANKIADSIRDVATSTGIAAEKIGEGVLTFAQAGIKDVKQLQAVAESLSKTQLDATFGDVQQTAEGLLAIFGQFGRELGDTVDTLDLIRQFSADFAVESQDIFEGIERGGAVFATAGGSFEEFIALFSVLRERTRESASSLGVFFKTGITQLLSPKSQTILRQLGIQSTNTIQQLRELSEVFFGVTSTLNDSERVNLGNQLVGQRQISRLLSLLRELNDPQVQDRISRAFELAPGSLDRAVVVRLDDVGQSLQRISQAFGDILKEFTQNEGIKQMVTLFADLTSTLRDFNKIAGPAIPLITGLATAATLGVVGRGVKSAVQFSLGRPTSAVGAFLGGVNAGVTDITGTLDSGRDTRNNQISDIILERRNTQRRIRATRDKVLRDQLKGEKKFWDQELRNTRGSIGTRVRRFGRNTRNVVNARGGAALGLGGLAVGTSLIGDNLRQRENEQGGIPSRFSAGDGFGVASAALTGAALGSFGGPIGAGIGAGVGASLSTISSITNNQRAIRQARLEQADTLAESFKAVSERTFGGQKNAAALLKDLSKNNEVGAEVKALINREAQSIFNAVTSGRNETLNALGDEIGRIRDDATISTSDKVSLIKTIDEQRANFVKKVMVESLQNLLVKSFDEAGIAGERQDINAIVVGSLKEIFADPKFQSQSTGKLDENPASKAGAVLRDAVRFSNLIIEDINQRFEKVSRDIESIYTDRNTFASVNASDDNFQLFEDAGLGFENVRQQIRDDAVAIQDFLAQLNQFSGGASFDSLLGNDFDTPTDIKKIVEAMIGGNEDTASALLIPVTEALDRFRASNGGDYVDTLKAIEGITDITEALNSGVLKDVQDSFAEVIRGTIDIYNQRIAKELELADKISQSNQTIEQLSKSLELLAFEGAGRADLARDFTNGNRNAAGIARRDASRLLGAAGTNIDVGALRNRALGASSRLSAALLARQAGNRDGSILSDVAATQNSDVINEEIAARQANADATREINEALGTFDRSVGLAAQATDILRQAFEGFRANLIAAGQTISGLTGTGLKDFQAVLRIFGKAGGFNAAGERGSNVGRALNDANFTPEGFDLLVQALRTLGDIDIGDGRTGNQTADEAFQELAVPGLAALLTSIRPGTTVGDNETFIRNAFGELSKRATEAAIAEDAFRASQSELIGIQRELAGLEGQFYQENIKILSEIATSIKSDVAGDVQKISGVVTRLFKDPLKTISVESALSSDPRINDLSGQIDATIKQIEESRKTKLGASSTDFASVRAELTKVLNIPTGKIGVNIPVIRPPTDQAVNEEIARRKEFQSGIEDAQRRLNELRKERDDILRGVRNDFIGGTPDSRRPSTRSETDENGRMIKRIQDADGNLVPFTFGEDVTNIKGQTENISELIKASNGFLQKMSEGGITSKMEVAPMQVNVALTVPDVMALIGPQIKDQVVAAVIGKLAVAFGDDPERYSRITAIT